MNLIRVLSIGLGIGTVGAIIFMYKGGDSSTNTNPNQSAQKIQYVNQPTTSRADDLTYAEEVKSLTEKTNSQNKLIDDLQDEIKKISSALNNVLSDVDKKSSEQINLLEKKLADTQDLLNSTVSSVTEESKKKLDEFSKNFEKNKTDTVVQDNNSGKSEFDIFAEEMAKSNADKKKEEKKEEIQFTIAPPTNSNDFKTPLNSGGFNNSFGTFNDYSGSSLTPDGYLAIKPFGNGDGKSNSKDSSFINTLTDFASGSLSFPQAKKDPNSDNPFAFTVSGSEAKPKPEPIPVYTIPVSSTLVDNTTMSPLIGVVPDLTNNINDPFRFRIVTGTDNLATNGISINGIENIVWSGYVVGVRDQSCVRAYVDTVTYTFEDGRISTYEKNRTASTSTTGSQFSGVDALGYLTDVYGKPCIRGEYISNAQKYLADRSFAALLGGIAEATSQSQMKYLENKDGDLSGFVTGNTGKYIAGAGIAGTANEIAKYVGERAAGAMDLIYVDSGINVQLFVEDQIPIDYDPNARKVNYEYFDN